VSEGLLVARRVVVAKVAAEGAVADTLAAVGNLFTVPLFVELELSVHGCVSVDVRAPGVGTGVVGKDTSGCRRREGGGKSSRESGGVTSGGGSGESRREGSGKISGVSSGVVGGVSSGEVGGVSGGVGGARSTRRVIVDVLDFGLGCVVPGVRYVYGDVVAGDVAVHGASAGAGGGSSVRDLDGGETDGHRDGGVLILGQVLGRVAAVVPAVDFGASTEVKTGGARVHPDAGDTLAVAATHVEHTAP